MAKAGFEVPDDVLSGNAGYISQFCGQEKLELKEPKLNGTYAIEKAYIKPYAACRYTHPSIDLAKKLRKETLLNVNEIKTVMIKTYSLAVKKHDHTEIEGVSSAKMSIPYNFAVTYLTGKTGMEAFYDDCIKSSDVLNLTKKVKVEEDFEMSKAFPAKTIAKVEITTFDGKVFSALSELPKGEPENPLSDDEIFEKFSSLAKYAGKNESKIKRIKKAVFNVEHSLSDLLILLR